MAEEVHGFTRRAAQRIVDATQRVEEMPHGRPAARLRQPTTLAFDPTIVRFELSAALAKGGTAAARLATRDESSGATTLGETVTVEDWIGSFSGQVGDRGYGRWWPDRPGFLEILQLACD